jgi:RNA polymerase sigma-70 factor (ECF subfamily)
MEHGTTHDMEKEFKIAFGDYGDAIFRYCLMKVSQVPLAEDLTQETFMRYWQSLRAGKEMTNTRSLLYTIANNLAKDWYKRKKADSLDARMELGHEPRAEGITAEELSAYREAIDAIDDMDVRDREVLHLAYVEGLDPRDIAEILDETTNVVSVRLNRAMKRLKEDLHV